MKSRTKQSLMKRVNSQSSFIATCEPSDTGTSYQLLHRTVGQHLSIVLFLLLSMGVGLGTATAQAQTRAYVARHRSNTVSVIDTATNTVVATIPVGQGPWEVAITPDGTRAYVTNVFSNTVSVIDTATNTVVATIPVGALGVAITPDGTRAYVTDGSSAVSVIDTATNTVVATIPVGVQNPFGVAITPDGTRAYVTESFDNTVSVIDTAINTVVATIPVGILPLGVAITPDGTRAYVTVALNNTVSVIDTATNTVVATIPAGALPSGVAVTPDGTRAYVINGNEGAVNGTVSVIDTATNTVVATIPVGDPNEVAITPDGTRAYVTTELGTVSVIDTATNTRVATIPVGGELLGIAITPSSLTTLTSSLNPSIYGQKVTFTATVAPSDKIMPTGKVNFTWSRFSIGSATLNSNGVATLARSNLNADPYPLTARYGGDANNPASTSAVLNQVVQEARSAATLTSSPNPSTQGQAVTFTAKITSPTMIPKGPVTFTAGKTVLGTAQLSGGKATLTISSLAVGSTKVTATYYGDSNIAKSSASVVQTVR